MNYSLEIKEKANIEISEAYTYYEELSEGLGERFLQQLDVYFERILESPKHYPEKYAPYREAFIKKFPFLIIYEITDQSIVVYSVFNTHQNPNKRKK